MTDNTHGELHREFVPTLTRTFRFMTRCVLQAKVGRWQRNPHWLQRESMGFFRLRQPVSARDLWTMLDRIGSEWTLSHFLQSLTHVDIPSLVRHRILGDVLTRSTRAAVQFSRTDWGKIDQLLVTLGISQDRRTDYLACLYTQYEGLLARQYDFPLTFREYSAEWLIHEQEMMRRFVPRYFGVTPSLASIRHAALLLFGKDEAKPCHAPLVSHL